MHCCHRPPPTHERVEVNVTAIAVCAQGNHCAMVSSGCKEESGLGVVCVRTPVGLSVDKWEQGLAEYARTHAAAETA